MRMQLSGLARAALTALIALLVAACGDGSTPTATTTAATIETFVAESSDPETFVAVVAETTSVAAATRQLRVYVCNGREIAAWFTGSTGGENLALTAVDGTSVSGRLSDDEVEGVVNLPGGRTLSFTALRAAGIAGLYEPTRSSENVYSGTSVDGRNHIEAVLGPRDGTGMHPLTVKFSSAAGNSVNTAYRVPVAPERARWIALEDGRMKGTDVHPMQEVFEKQRR